MPPTAELTNVHTNGAEYWRRWPGIGRARCNNAGCRKRGPGRTPVMVVVGCGGASPEVHKDAEMAEVLGVRQEAAGETSRAGGIVARGGCGVDGDAAGVRARRWSRAAGNEVTDVAAMVVKAVDAHVQQRG